MDAFPVIDLYSGVGGFSLGAARAGFQVRAAVDTDPIALKWHTANFPSCRHIERDVATLAGSDLLALAGIGSRLPFGLIGGPPCQGFSTIGKMNRDDPRNALFSHFFRLVAETRPVFFVAENVPAILSERYRGVVAAALERLPAAYRVAQTAVRASDIGAPTTRTRIFFIGIDSDRADAEANYRLEPVVTSATTVGRALEGLPCIEPEWREERQSWRRVGDLPGGDFFFRVCGDIPKGVGNPGSLKRYAADREASGFFGTMHMEGTIRRFSGLKPGEEDPVSRARRLDPTGFCPTLRAGTGPDRGSFQALRPIHPTFPRVIAPREAARLQGFPDWFVFHPTKWHSFRQIGNSVSPLVAEAVLTQVRRTIARTRSVLPALCF